MTVVFVLAFQEMPTGTMLDNSQQTKSALTESGLVCRGKNCHNPRPSQPNQQRNCCCKRTQLHRTKIDVQICTLRMHKQLLRTVGKNRRQKTGALVLLNSFSMMIQLEMEGRTIANNLGLGDTAESGSWGWFFFLMKQQY